MFRCSGRSLISNHPPSNPQWELSLTGQQSSQITFHPIMLYLTIKEPEHLGPCSAQDLPNPINPEASQTSFFLGSALKLC